MASKLITIHCLLIEKGMIGILTVAVLVMGLAAPIVMNVTKMQQS